MRQVIIILMGAVLLSACTRQIYVPVESVLTDTLREYRMQADTIIRLDSVAVDRRGDTVLLTRTRERIKIRHRIDTVYRSVTDSVAVPYPVEQPLSRWQKAKMDIGAGATGVLALAAVIIPVILIRKIKR